MNLFVHDCVSAYNIQILHQCTTPAPNILFPSGLTTALSMPASWADSTLSLSEYSVLAEIQNATVANRPRYSKGSDKGQNTLRDRIR